MHCSKGNIMGWLSDVVNKVENVVTNPVQAIDNTVNTLSKDASNIGNAVTSLVTDPSLNNIKNITAQTLANPGVSALAGAALVATGVGAPLAAAIVGGTDALATGSLSKGISAGIGAYGGANIGADALSAGQAINAGTDATAAAQTPSFATNISNMATGISSPDALTTAAGGAGSLALSGLQAANSSNGNAITNAILPKSNTPTTGTGTAVPADSNYTATVGGNPSGMYYNRNPIPASQLNLIGSQYTPGENPDTSERTYFQPSYSTTQGPTPVATASPTTYTPQTNPASISAASVPAGNFTQVAGTNASVPNLVGASSMGSIAAANPQLAAILNGTSTNTPVTMAAAGGLQNTPQGMAVNQTNPSAPMAYNLEDAYHRPYAQNPVPQPVMKMAEGGLDHHAHMAAIRSIAEDKGKGYNLGGYSDGGRLLRGPGDGVSDSIPATIGHRQPARLADGEFVVPARHVSELGNGSTEAGARKLYAMLDRIQNARAKTVGKKKGSIDSKADKALPA